MQDKINAAEQGFYLTLLATGTWLSHITLNTVISLTTLCGGLLYLCNQAFILRKNISGAKKKNEPEKLSRYEKTEKG